MSLAYVDDNKGDVIYEGDFNIDMLSDTDMKREMDVVIKTNGWLNVINEFTRITLSTQTLIDFFFTNFDSETVKPGIITYKISDHLPVFPCVAEKQNKK